ncbi:MAG: sugar phosphate isomerase/epimerase [Mesorhizobium sp.]|nr:sugar phosphate isomerase/epimerase family protein [Mesorhizobium sp.]RUV30368.1 sugar phosphate isomerase/epimerase [Mesorhizobium sp. M5C.F.Ca.IN.020.32.2.1]RUV95472.1 sugar phosphate isomerase/epimerase [Mesorhizobium sp. M5C.F.Ca.IN.020.14.1.1]RWE89208.1 MAG: sugar phosphate isomerase/epimerase [Mesorhizobium sp.]RWG51498.1 MAG: sugar phosphate isomerase/epimerase [Mesorhizobium sp.]RWH48471.1 MAG: sugar phosphate isomerase/epimerase [Mesorhizobium sp.]
MRQRNQIIFHSLAAKHGTLALDLDITRKLGFDGLEGSGAKIRQFLDAGFSEAELRTAIGDTFIPGIGFLLDVERHGDDRRALLKDASDLIELATAAGAKGLEAITGPISLAAYANAAAVPDLYRGVIGLPLQEQIHITAAGLASVADIAAERGLLIYYEALSWTPLNTLDKQLRTLERAGRSNIKLVIDFWHCYTAGETPESVARLDKDLIYGVHICDSLPFDGGIPDEGVLRDVPTGKGVLDLKEWVDAVKATGFQGWWSCELFCRRQHQENSYEIAAGLKTLMEDLIGV